MPTTPAKGHAPAKGRPLTGAMTSAIVTCNDPSTIKILEAIFDALTGDRVGKKQAEILLYAAGIDGDSISPKDLHHVVKHFEVVSVGFLRQQLDGTMRTVRTIGGLPVHVDFTWFQHTLTGLRANDKQTARVSPVEQPRISKPTPPNPVPARREFTARCVDDQQLSFVRGLLRALDSFSDNDRDDFLCFYGIDGDALLVPRKAGALVGRRKRFKMAEDVEVFIGEMWQRIYDIDDTLTEAAFRQHLGRIRLGQPSPNGSMVRASVEAVEPLITQAPAKTVRPPSPATTTDTSWFIPAEFTEIVDLCREASDRNILTELISALARIPRALAESVIKGLGLRNGTTPTLTATLAAEEGITTAGIYLRQAGAFEHAHRAGLNLEITLTKVRGIAYSLRNTRVRGVKTRIEVPSTDKRTYLPVGILPEAMKLRFDDLALRVSAADQDDIRRIADALPALSANDLDFFDRCMSITSNEPPPSVKALAPIFNLSATSVSTKLGTLWSRLADAGFKRDRASFWFRDVVRDVRCDTTDPQFDFDLNHEERRLTTACAETDRELLTSLFTAIRQLSRRQQRFLVVYFRLAENIAPLDGPSFRKVFGLTSEGDAAAKLTDIIGKLHAVGMSTAINGHTIRRLAGGKYHASTADDTGRAADVTLPPSSQVLEARRFQLWCRTLPSYRDRAMALAWFVGLTGSGPNSPKEMAEIFNAPIEEVDETIGRILGHYDRQRSSS